jgi:hypothetical protein
MLCEGEKSADALNRIFPDHVAMTSPGGAMAAAKADWAPLAGRAVIIWPDHDETGAAYALEVAAILLGLGSAVSIIDVARLAEIDGGKRRPDRETEGWDAADAIGEWADIGALKEAALGLVELYRDPLVDLVELAPILTLELREHFKRFRRVWSGGVGFGACETLRVRLKQAGCRVTGLDDALKALEEDGGETRDRKPRFSRSRPGVRRLWADKGDPCRGKQSRAALPADPGPLSGANAVDDPASVEEVCIVGQPSCSTTEMRRVPVWPASRR